MICQDGFWLTEGPADLAAFPWPEGVVWQEARAWLEPMVRQGTEVFVRNAPAELHLLRAGNAVLPVTVEHPGPDRSYVVSPWAQYVAYAGEEVVRLPRLWQRGAARGTLGLLKPFLDRPRLERVVQVNNWLVSTNLWPGGMEPLAGRIVELIRARWPDRAVVFRSLDAIARPELLEVCRRAGGRPVFSRVVTYQNPQGPDFWRNRQLRVDRKRWRREGWQARALGPEDAGLAGRLQEFYGALYLEKYSRLNPDFTETFFREALLKGFLKMEGLWKADGVLTGGWGWWARDGVMTQPLFGYDPTGPDKAAPYAALSLQVLERAWEQGFRVNASGGAAGFKQQRGGVPAVEYHIVFDQHLSPKARRPWALLEHLIGPRAQEWLRQARL